MYSFIAFMLTLIQLAVVFGSYAMQAQTVFATAVIYGSPLYLIRNLLNAESAWISSSPLYLILLAYHIIKYVIFFRARLSEGGSMALTAAIIFEAAYLLISGYYII